MEDIAPKLLEEIKTEFNNKVKRSKKVSSFLLKVKNGKADFTDAQLYSKELGEILGNTFKEVLKAEALPDGRLYWNIAEKTIKPMLHNNYELVMSASEEVQKIIDIIDGIGLKPVRPKLNNDRVKGLLDNATNADLYTDEAQKRITEPTINITESFFDDFIKTNAQVRYLAGLNPQIIRTAESKACKWCKAQAGVYDYEDVSDTGSDVFRRHENCHCQVIYKNGKQRQDVWTKKMK